MHATKRKFLGEYIFETASARHEQLNDEEWLVAYFTAHGMKQGEIEVRMHLKRRRVSEIMRDIKDKITMEFNCELKSVRPSQITSWFFGL
jgi:DNA-binding NarL/FixJ family response regulator